MQYNGNIITNIYKYNNITSYSIHSIGIGIGALGSTISMRKYLQV